MDVRPEELRSQTLGETHLRELRRRVRAHVGNAALADDRRDDDQVAASLTAKHRQRRARGEVGAQVVDVDELLHLIGADVFDRAGDAEPGVAHHHVEPPEPLDRARHERLHVGFARHVGGDRQRRAAAGGDLRRERVEAIDAPRAHDHRGPLPREPQRRRASDPCRCARDGDDAI